MSKRTPNLLIEDIEDSINKIIIYTKGMTFDEFIDDSKTVDAVTRNFEIIGEATNRLPDKFKEQYPTIDWHKNYFSDGGDEIHEVLDECLKAEGRATIEKIRNYMLSTAKEIDEYFRSHARNVDGFEAAMRPIYDFAVEV